ncbi:MAG: DUF4469 domain-containing protein [Treponema sp.]|jgi:hypothetical protein|nr:DUF4469 domain-containing protein [Treponema sp.]
MALGFDGKDIKHGIAVKFAPSTLPGAKKPYRLRPMRQPVLDIHALAGKAEVYKISTDPMVIETGLSAGMKLISYLLADGYSFDFPLFKLTSRIPGEYDGTETSLPDGVFPQARFRPSARLRRFLENNAKIVFTGKENNAGIIGETHDEASGSPNETVTAGSLLTVRGRGLKIQADEAHRDEAGLYFEDSGGTAIKAELVALNEPRTLKALVPSSLKNGTAYTLLVRTQGAANGKGTLLKELREFRSEFSLTACTCKL